MHKKVKACMFLDNAPIEQERMVLLTELHILDFQTGMSGQTL